MKRIQDIGDIKGRRVLVRVDFNVHFENGQIENDFRILRTLPTISYLRDKGARVILLSHIDSKEGETLKGVLPYLESFFKVSFVPELSGAALYVREMNNGDVVLFENLRRDPREELNDESFARELASFGEYYVNEAFSTSHRTHASIVGIPKFLPSFVGLQFQAEVKHLREALTPPHPALLIVGGAKPETKVPLIEKFLPIADSIFVCGIPANEIYKSRGYEMGKTIVSLKPTDVSKISSGENVLVPHDVVVRGHRGTLVKSPDSILKDEAIVDIGPKSLRDLIAIVKKSKLVIWNGPLGIYEEGFIEHTNELAKEMAKSNSISIVGGGDTYSAIGSLRLEDSFTFVSTAGGAMIDYLADGDLPGITALDLSK